MQFNRSGMIRLSALFWAGLLFANANFAEDASHVRLHGLEQLLEAAIGQSQSLEAIRGKSAVLRERSNHLSHWDDPEVRLGYGRDVNVGSDLKTSRYPRHEYDASLRIFPRNPWEVSARKGKIEAKQAEVQLRMEVQTKQLRREVEELYWDASYTQAEREAQAALVEIKQAQAKGVQTLLQNGQVTLDESLPIQMEQLESVLEMDALEQELHSLMGQLSRLTGVAAEQIHLVPAPAIPADAFDLPYDTWKQRAVKNRLELAIFNAKIDYSKAALKEAHASDIPWIKHIEGGYQVVNDYGDRDSYAVQIAISIPWFTDRDGGLASAQAELNSQHRQKMLSRKQIEAEVSRLVKRFRFEYTQWQRYQSEIRPMADILRETVRNLEAGQRSSSPSYWNTKSALLELEFKELRLSKRYLKLRLQAEAVLGGRLEV